MILPPPPHVDPRVQRRLGAVAVVAALHVALFVWLGAVRGAPPVLAPAPIIQVDLIQPPPPPPPPPPPKPPAPTQGGGAPAAPSIVHTPSKPRPVPPEVPAPPVKAPEQPLVVGVAPVATPTPGFGQGGQGQGTGSGIGDGDGPGSGGLPARIVAGPTRQQIVREYPREALRQRISARVTLRCTVGLNQRLQGCRVADETPPGYGFGEAALRASVNFRVLPPTSGGRPVADAPFTVGIEFRR